MADDEVLDIEQVADLLGFHPEYVRRMARAGKVPAVKIGRRWRFVRGQLIDWLKAGAPAQPRRLGMD